MAHHDVELPPILPDIADELKQYLLCPERLPIHRYESNQEFWPREPNLKELFHYSNSPLCTTLKVQRDPNTGEILEFREVPIPCPGADAKTSMSLTRAPAPPSEATRGNASYVPFWPGSFPDPVSQLPKQELLEDELLTIPPGFSRGITFDKEGKVISTQDKNQSDKGEKVEEPKNVINLLDILHQERDFFGSSSASPNTPTTGSQNKNLHPSITNQQTSENSSSNLPEEDEIIPEDPPVLNISSVPPSLPLKGTEWAVLLDTSKPVKDFQEKIPEMAHEFPFELDTFQKLAVLHLERHDHVFVAAHTSAGKTVVAEYAIALSQRHMTRTIYTSPIKALSNQKYRDFKRQFKDVGLITGKC